MADLKAQLEIAADASGVEAGVGQAKKSLASLGVTAQQEGRKASEGMKGVGERAHESSAKVDRATRSIIGSIERTTATLQAGSRTSAGYFEALARQRGANLDTLRPYLQQLDAVQSKQRSATAALAASAPAITQVGISARQAAAAMRGVPAQFTDIVTAIQGGQNPITVFLQQGGQLKDMFGGIGPAARALGGYVAGLISPLTLAAGAVAALGVAYFQGSKEADAFARAIILTGNAAGTTVGQLTAMAQRIDSVVGTQAQAAAALAQFAANGNIAAESLEHIATVAIKMEKETGQAVSETVKQFAELARSPLEASIKLNESTNHLTESVYRQIKALDEQGRTAEAAALAQKAYADTLDQRLGQLQNRLGYIERGWRGLVGAAKEAWDAMLNVGRPDTLQDQLSKAQTELERRQRRGPSPGWFGGVDQSYERGNQALRERIANLSESIRIENRAADSTRRTGEQVRATIEWDKSGAKYASEQVKMQREIALARTQGLKAGKSQAEIEKRIADIRASYAKKGPKTSTPSLIGLDRSELALEVDSIRNANEQLMGVYSNSERLLESVRAAGLLSEREYYEAKRGFLNLQRDAQVRALEQEVEALTKEKGRIDAEVQAMEDRKAKPTDVIATKRQAIELEKQLGDAVSKLQKVQTDAATQGEILANQQAAAVRRLELSYLSAKQAAEDYLDSLTRQQDRALAGFGQGARQRNFDSGVNQIEDRYAQQRREMENQRAQLEFEGKFNEDARRQYDQRLALIDDYQRRAIDSFTDYYDRLTKAEQNWVNGFTESMANYVDTAQNTAAEAQNLFDGVFSTLEDTMAEFVRTGKLSFKDLFESIAAEITRFTTRQLLGDWLKQLQGGMSGGGSGFLASIGQAIGSRVGTNTTDPSSANAQNGHDVGGAVASAAGAAQSASQTAAASASAAALTTLSTAASSATAAVSSSTAAESAAAAATSAFSAAQTAAQSAIASASASSAAALASLTSAAATAAAALASVAASSGSSAAGGIVGAVAGARATGGPVSAGGLYRVNENGPELLQVAGKQYLMMGDQGGKVEPTAAPAASGSTHIHVTVAPPAGANRDTMMQWGSAAGRSIRHAVGRNG